MPTSCPKCNKTFAGQSIGSHAVLCNVTMTDLFWQKVNKEAPNGCWEWTASRKERGYGQFLYKDKMHRAHRLAWKLLRGDPGNLEVAHRCDNRICVNPDHLFLATHDENMKDCKAKGRQSKGETSGRNVLTEEMVVEIRKEFRYFSKRKTNAYELAEKYGFRPATIYLAATGRTWSHLK